MENNVFDVKKIREQQIFAEKCQNVIGVYSDGINHAYTLVRRHKENQDIDVVLLSKTLFGENTKDDFDKEVSDLAKYFNAVLIEEF